MIYNWNEIGIVEITNLFLYGEITIPEDKTIESLIREKDAPPDGSWYGPKITVDMASFMDTGPGRFALGSESLLVQTFFTNDISWMEVGRIYTKSEMLAAFNLDTESDRINIKQSELADSISDYSLRSYVWNGGSPQSYQWRDCLCAGLQNMVKLFPNRL